MKETGAMHEDAEVVDDSSPVQESGEACVQAGNDCARFGAGHVLHYIGSRVLLRSDEWQKVSSLRCEGNWLYVAVDGEEAYRGWYHKAAVLEEFVEAVNDGHSSVESLHSRYIRLGRKIIDLNTDGPTPCRPR